MFYLIGLGLCDGKDVSLRGLEIIKKCNRVYLESYTSVLNMDKEILEALYNRQLITADREYVEEFANELLPVDEKEDVALLVVGDPLGATTHADLILRAKEKNLEVKIVHNASIMTAIGCCGLQLYLFGETVSIPLWTSTTRPFSFYDKIASNRQRGLHTLCLLDIQIKEFTYQRSRKEYLPTKMMTVNEAASQLIEILDERLKNEDRIDLAFTSQSLAVGLARVGSDNQRIVACSLRDMTSVDLGPPLHCLIIPAVPLHHIEADFLKSYALKTIEFDKMAEVKSILTEID